MKVISFKIKRVNSCGNGSICENGNTKVFVYINDNKQIDKIYNDNITNQYIVCTKMYL